MMVGTPRGSVLSDSSRGRRRATTVLVVLALAATACGARLDPAVRDQAIAGMARTGGTVTTGGEVVDGSVVDSGAPGASGSNTVPGQVGGAGGVTSPGVVGGGVAQGSPSGTPGTPGGAVGPGTQGPSSSGVDTRSAPPGGNGGATDIGVYEDRIVIGNAVDNSGAVPGIFLDSQLATQAFVAWFNSTEGTIYGRRLELRTRDSRLDAGGNREAYLDFCENAFAGVGSMSAFDEGIAEAVEACKIPDIRSAVVNGKAMAVSTVFSADAISITQYPTNHYIYWDQTYPGAKEAAGILYVDNDTTQKQTRLMRAVAEKVGYKFVVDRAVGLAETNYSTYVIELKEKGVKFVEFQGDAPQVVRLAKAMRQQAYWPDVFALQQNVYKPALIQQGGVDVEGVELALGSVMNENIQHHPELQTYRQWLKQIDPSAEPTGQGAYSWGAGLLFVELVKQIGPDLTREKLVNALLQVHDFDGNGLFPPQDVGNRFPTNCHIMAKVQGGRFVPTSPADGLTFQCRGKTEQV